MRAFVAGLLAFAAGTSVWSAPPAVEAFFREPSFSAAQLSPDGRKVAFLIGEPGKRTRLGVIDLETMKPAVAASYATDDVVEPAWVNEERIVFTLQAALSGPGRIASPAGLYAVNADGGQDRSLLGNHNTWGQGGGVLRDQAPWKTFLHATALSAGSDDVFAYTPDEVGRGNVGFFHLLRINTRTGRAVEVDAPQHAVDWLLDDRDRLRVVTTARDNQVAVHVVQPDGQWKRVSQHESLALDGVRPRWIGPDGAVYVVTRVAGDDKLGVFVLDATTGRPSGKPLLAVAGFDIAPVFVADANKLLGIRVLADAEVTHWFDARMKALQERVDALLPDTANRISVPLRPAAPYVMVQAFADVQPTLTYVYNTETRKLTLLGRANPSIDPKTMGQTDFLRFKARDGLEIPAYLTLPPGVDAKSAKGNKLPMVVLVHGGPWVRGMAWRWDPEVQFLATRGYAVLQPEFRGSTGFGARHFEAGFKQWGLAMQDDVADAARWAIAQGVADPKRICIAGASYGGYATLMGLARDPDLFRCGINWVGVTDINLMYSAWWSDIGDEAKRYGYPLLIGDPVADKAALAAASPIANAARIKQPLLMAYGAWDVRVPIEHGQRFRDAVMPHNPNVEWVVYDNEGHGWRRQDNRVDFWTRVEKFLARYLAAAP